MSGPSIYHWSWFVRPEAYIENGLIFAGNEAEPYHPGDNPIDLLNAVREIIDGQTALGFAKQWGILGLIDNPAASDDRRSQIYGATEFTYGSRIKAGLDPDLKEIKREVLKYFNPCGGHNLSPKGEPVSAVLNFAQRVRALSEVKRLLELYKEDAYAASYEVEEWINSLTSEQIKGLFNISIEILKKQYGSGDDKQGLYYYILDVFINAARGYLSDRSQRGIWIELHTFPIMGHSTGLPVIQFDSLFRFIEYILLVEGAPSPKRCADPKCSQLFFPTKSDQRYCPPPTGVKRSRCENRHGQWLRREEKKKQVNRAGE